MAAATAEEQEQRRVVYGASTGKGLATSHYLDQWLDQCGQKPKVEMRPNDLLKKSSVRSFLSLN